MEKSIAKNAHFFASSNQLLVRIDNNSEIEPDMQICLLKIFINMIKKSLILLMILMCTLSVMGQDIFYYGPNERPVDSPEEALFSKEIIKKSDKKYQQINRFKTQDTWAVSERYRINVHADGELKIRIKDDRFLPTKITRTITKSEPGLYYFEEKWKDITQRTGNSSRFLPLHLEGQVSEYHKNGNKRSVTMFRDNQIMYNQNWLPDGTPYIDSIYYSADQNPVFVPGQEYFREFLMQQLINSQINLEEYDDDVIIGWTVMENGVIDGVVAIQGKSKILNQTLVDIIAQLPGKWEPAVLDGDPVRYFMSIPLNIRHNDARFQGFLFTGGVIHYERF